MAVTTNRVRVFSTVTALEYFIRNDVDISSIVSISTDDNGAFVLIYDIA